MGGANEVIIIGRIGHIRPIKKITLLTMIISKSMKLFFTILL